MSASRVIVGILTCAAAGGAAHMYHDRVMSQRLVEAQKQAEWEAAAQRKKSQDLFQLQISRELYAQFEAEGWQGDPEHNKKSFLQYHTDLLRDPSFLRAHPELQPDPSFLLAHPEFREKN